MNNLDMLRMGYFTFIARSTPKIRLEQLTNKRKIFSFVENTNSLLETIPTL